MSLSESYSKAIADLYQKLEQGIINPIIKFYETKGITLSQQERDDLLGTLTVPLRSAKVVAKAKTVPKKNGQTEKKAKYETPKPISKGKWGSDIYDVDVGNDTKFLNPITLRPVQLGKGTYKKLVKAGTIPEHPKHKVEAEVTKVITKPKNKVTVPKSVTPKAIPLKTAEPGEITKVIDSSDFQLPDCDEYYELVDDAWYFMIEPKLIIKAEKVDGDSDSQQINYYIAYEYGDGKWTHLSEEKLEKYSKDPNLGISLYTKEQYSQMDPEADYQSVKSVNLAKTNIYDMIDKSESARIAKDIGVDYRTD